MTEPKIWFALTYLDNLHTILEVAVQPNTSHDHGIQRISQILCTELYYYLVCVLHINDQTLASNDLQFILLLTEISKYNINE